MNNDSPKSSFPNGGILSGILAAVSRNAEDAFLDFLPRLEEEYSRFGIDPAAPNALRLLALNLLREKYPPAREDGWRKKPQTQERLDANFYAILSAMLKPTLNGKHPKGINAAVKGVARQSHGKLKQETLGPAFHKHRLKPLLDKLGAEGLRLHLNQALYPLDSATSRFAMVNIFANVTGQRTLSQKASEEMWRSFQLALPELPMRNAYGRLKTPTFSGLALAAKHRLSEAGAFVSFEMLSNQPAEFRALAATATSEHAWGVAIVEAKGHLNGEAGRFAKAFVEMGAEKPAIIQWHSRKDYQPVSLVFSGARTPPELLSFHGPIPVKAERPEVDIVGAGILGQVV